MAKQITVRAPLPSTIKKEYPFQLNMKNHDTLRGMGNTVTTQDIYNDIIIRTDNLEIPDFIKELDSALICMENNKIEDDDID